MRPACSSVHPRGLGLGARVGPTPWLLLQTRSLGSSPPARGGRVWGGDPEEGALLTSWLRAARARVGQSPGTWATRGEEGGLCRSWNRKGGCGQEEEGARRRFLRLRGQGLQNPVSHENTDMWKLMKIHTVASEACWRPGFVRSSEPRAGV